MQNHSLKPLQRIIGFVGVAILLAIFPLSMLENQATYQVVSNAEDLTVLGTPEAQAPLEMPDEGGPLADGRFLVQMISIDAFTRTPVASWSKELHWPEASNQVHQVTFPGQSKSEKLTVSLTSLRWRRQGDREQVPSWQRRELKLRSLSYTDIESNRSAGLQAGVSYEQVMGRSGHRSGSTGVYSGGFKPLVQMRSNRTGSPQQQDWLMCAIVPLGPDTEIAELSVLPMVPALVTALQAQEKISLQRHHRVERPTVPHGIELIGRFRAVFLIGCIGCVWACGLFRRPMIALACMAVGFVFYLGLIDRMRSFRHLERVEDTSRSIPDRMIAASLAGQSFFHMGPVSKRLLDLHDQVALEQPLLSRVILDHPEVLRGVTLDADQDYLDTEVLRKIIELDDPETYERVKVWADSSPLRSYEMEDGHTFYNNIRQILSCTTNRMGLVWQVRAELGPLRQHHLPPGLMLKEVEVKGELVRLNFTFNEALAKQIGATAGKVLHAQFKTEELFGDQYSDYNRMAFSKASAPDPIQDHLNALIFLKRAGGEAADISPVKRTVKLEGEGSPYTLEVQLPFNFRLSTLRNDPGLYQVHRLTRQDPYLQWYATVYVGDEPKRPFSRVPREYTEHSGRFTWKVYPYPSSSRPDHTYYHTLHQPAEGPPIYIVVTGNSETETEVLLQAFDEMEIQPR